MWQHVLLWALFLGVLTPLVTIWVPLLLLVPRWVLKPLPERGQWQVMRPLYNQTARETTDLVAKYLQINKARIITLHQLPLSWPNTGKIHHLYTPGVLAKHGGKQGISFHAFHTWQFFSSVVCEAADMPNVTVRPLVRSPQMYVATIKHTTLSSFRDLKYSRNLCFGFQVWYFHCTHRKWMLWQDQKRTGSWSLTGYKMSSFATLEIQSHNIVLNLLFIWFAP